MVSRYRRRGGICAIALAFALASGVVATAAAEPRRAADPPAPPAAPELGSTLGAFAPIADRPYPGLITLNVDAADLDHHVLHVVESVPVEGPDRRDEFLLNGIADQAASYGFTASNVTPDRWMEEGDTLTLGPHRFDVLHCPGHTPGSLVFVNQQARFALVGDVLFQGSIGRTDFPYGDHAALIAAIKTKLLPLGDDMTFLCGHGPGSTIGAEKASNPFLQ